MIVIPTVLLQLFTKLKEKWHKKTKEEIENEMKIKTVIHIPSLNPNSKSTTNRGIFIYLFSS